MTRSISLNDIRKLLFYLLDLSLYLDNFPECSKAAEDYEALASKCKKYLYEYEQSNGPLFSFEMSYTQNPEAWIETPWPWEKCKDGE